MTQESTTRRSAILSLSLTAAGVLVSGCPPLRGPNTNSSPDPGGAKGPVPVEDCEETGPQTAGPFYPEEPDLIMNITGNRAGVPLDIEFRVVDVAQDCAAVANAEVDLWHADANGDYSGYEAFDTVGEDWLRGQQLTDTDGIVRFRTIFPGSYPGRSVHVHVKVRGEGHPELTTQIYFPDDLAASVLEDPEYGGAPLTLLSEDDHFSAETLSDAEQSPKDGIVAKIVLGLA